MDSEPGSPGISIVIPAWNEEDRLARTLERYLPALESRGEPYEVIVVVDGVRDRTAEVAARYAARHVRVLRSHTPYASSSKSVLARRHLGLAEARNLGREPFPPVRGLQSPRRCLQGPLGVRLGTTRALQGARSNYGRSRAPTRPRAHYRVILDGITGPLAPSKSRLCPRLRTLERVGWALAPSLAPQWV